MRVRGWLFTLSLLLLVSSAAAQKRTTIGFDTDCTGAVRNDPPGTFILGYEQIAGSFYAACGAASITSGSVGGTQQLARSSGLMTIPGVTDSIALAGAFVVNGALTFNPVVIVFSPPVNELSFDALGLDNPSGLSVTLNGAANAALPPVDNPTAQGGVVKYTRTSATPIERVTIGYTPGPTLGDGWFLDQLSFNAWSCGDAEIENDLLNPAWEACDDGNQVQCDGCGNTCQATTIGCLGGGTCVAPGAVGGCTRCDMATTPNADGNIPTTPRPAMTACDDGLFCTIGDVCDGAGVCAAQPNPCSDGVVCTADSCSEATKTCLHPIEDQWCLIAGTCVANGTVNPTNKCELCTSTKRTSAWDKQPVGLQCGNPTCTNGMGSASEAASASCDANGVCQPGATTTCQFPECANSTSCSGLCTGDHSCVEQAHCVLTTQACVPDLAMATACTRNAECASSFCVDGVCCDKICNGACQSCNLPNLAGTCSPLPDKAIDPQNMCPAAQYCTVDGKCMAEPTPPEAPITPPPTMVDIRPMGTGCTEGSVCGSGVCRDGVCCDRACEGVCESCNVPGQPPGQCLPFAVGDDPDNECTAAGAVCSGESSCTSYETRGNGLCGMGAGTTSRAPYAHALSALLLSLFALRRRGSRLSQR